MEINETLDLKGVPCPQNSARTLIKLAGMDKGEILQVILDDGEPIENVPPSIEDEDEYKIVSTEQNSDGSWRLVIRVERS
ncbi:MAG: sulfurtransferase TusA family protein [Bacteroidota bacterium]|nr:sulfurtransferase TusA family protein [Bacteroidota bacterium]